MHQFYHFLLLLIILILSCIYKCLLVAGFITIVNRFLFCTIMLVDVIMIDDYDAINIVVAIAIVIALV